MLTLFRTLTFHALILQKKILSFYSLLDIAVNSFSKEIVEGLEIFQIIPGGMIVDHMHLRHLSCEDGNVNGYVDLI